MIASGNEMELI